MSGERGRRIILEEAVQTGWLATVLPSGGEEAPVTGAFTDSYDLICWLCKIEGLPMPAHERPEAPPSEKRFLPKVFRGEKT